MKCKEDIRDDGYIVTYQNITSGREHAIRVDGCDLEDVIAWHKARRNLVSVVPYAAYQEGRYI